MCEEIISVIVPVYNVEMYLERCLKSIINQTYKSLQIILIDDGSTDRSGKICDKYAKVDSRIFVIHQKNSGVSSARNKALKLVKGKYISFIDADDMLLNNMYEIMINDIQENNANISVCGVENISEKNKTINFSKLKENKICNKDEFLEDMITEKVTSSLWNKLFKTSNTRNIFFNENRRVGEDLEWIINFLNKNNNIKIIYNKEILYRYLIRQNSATKKLNDKQANDILEVNYSILKLYENKNSKIESLILKRILDRELLFLKLYNLSNDFKRFIIEDKKEREKLFYKSKGISLKSKLKYFVKSHIFNVK